MKLKYLSIFIIIASAPLFAQDSVARYSIALPKPSQAQLEPLATVVQVRLPRNLKTVRQAFEYLLAPTGYALATSEHSDPYIGILYSALIPETQRDIGFLRIDDALAMLAGSPWELIEDPVSRLVSFEMRASFRAIYNREFE